MEFRKGYYGDIDFGSVYPAVGGAAIVVFLLAALIVGIICGDASEKNKRIEAYNANALEFNARPEMEREIIASYLDGGEYGENYTLILDEGTVDTKALAFKSIRITIIVAIIILSFTTTACYIAEKQKCYYFADLPFREPYGWFLFFSMFVFWPVLLVSGMRMLKVRAGERSLEKQEVEVVAQQELKDEADARRTYTRKTSAKAKRLYIKYRVQGQAKAYEHRKSELEKRIESRKRDLRSYNEHIQSTQREIGSIKAELNELDKADLGHEVVRKQAQEEWRAISEMRGVSKIWLNRDIINILVKVRVPYKNHVYDFGDYKICIGIRRCTCERVRSGVKINATSSRPDYNESSGFCFGQRRDLIHEYLQHARMLEAITLMIDCLHSVNEGDEVFIPNCFRRVDKIESAKRRLKKRQKS